MPEYAKSVAVYRELRGVLGAWAKEELDELREIQNAIDRKRPRTPELAEWMRENSTLGEATRALYKQYAAGEKPYRVGDFATFGYFSIEDVRRHAWFLVRHLPYIVARFLEGRSRNPIQCLGRRSSPGFKGKPG